MRSMRPARGKRPGAKLGSFRKNANPPARDEKLASFRKKADSSAEAIAESSARDGRFRVLVAVHRPRYRARVERAMTGFDWEVRSLLNKEDPVGKIHQKPPHVFVISDDFGRQKDLGILRAVQKFRASGMKIIALFEDADSAAGNEELSDDSIVPPWTTGDMRRILSEVYAEITGNPVPEADSSNNEDKDG